MRVMNKFLFKATLFTSLSILGMLTFFFLSFVIEKVINLNSSETKIAILGHSHAETAVNDSLLGELTSFKVRNYGRGGQSMFWTITGGKKIKYQGVKYFIIEYTNNTYTTDWKTTDAKRGVRESQKKYFLTPADWRMLFKKNKKFSMNLLFKPTVPQKQLEGRFTKLEKTFVNKVVKGNSLIVNNIDFNDQIVHDFVSKNDSCFYIFMRAPQHPDYYKLIGKESEQFFLEKLDSFKKYKNCFVLDMGHSLLDDTYFADLEHLNYQGANKFTKILADTLAKSEIFSIKKLSK